MRKILNAEQENWLYQNYSDMPNKQLAAELTAMVKAENEKQIKRLTDMLPQITDAHTLRAIKRNIGSLSLFEEFTISNIRTYARRLHCPPKSRNLRSEQARKSANEKNVKLWASMAVETDLPPMEFFRTFCLYEKKIIRMKDNKQIRNFRSCMSTWNRIEGYDKGIFIVSNVLPGTNIIRFEATINRASGAYGS